MTDFGTTLGYPPLREHVARRVGELGIGVAPSQVLLTTGATQGFDLLIRYLREPGRRRARRRSRATTTCSAICSSPACGSCGAARRRRSRSRRARRARRAASAEVYFTMSVLNNPTCTHIQPAVAHRLLQLAARHRFYVVEDDIFSDFADGAPPRLAALDRLERTFYLGSFSKTLSRACASVSWSQRRRDRGADAAQAARDEPDDVGVRRARRPRDARRRPLPQARRAHPRAARRAPHARSRTSSSARAG